MDLKQQQFLFLLMNLQFRAGWAEMAHLWSPWHQEG